MKRTVLHSLFYGIIAILMLGIVSCKKDDETIASEIVGKWKVQNDEINYQEGVLTSIIGGATGIDTESAGTLLSTVSALFKNSTMIFEANGAGKISKGLADSDGSGDNGFLGDLLGNLTGNLLATPFTYTISNGTLNLKLKMSDKTYQINVVDIDEAEMTLAIKVADMTDLSSNLLQSTTGIGENNQLVEKISSICDAIDNIGGKFNIPALNPRITMKYTKQS